MRKIFFNDKYGLTNAVLQGTKTMTRRIVGNRMTEDDIKAYLKGYTELADKCAQYKIGEVVAVAQSYKDLGYTKEWVEQHISPNPNANWNDPFEKKYPGWSNKMFVKPDLMLHQIRITDIKVERLQDISNEDCEEEGIIPVTWRQYHKQDWDDLSPQRYTDHDVWTLPIFKEGILDPWAESHPDEFIADEPKTAFYVLIRKMMGVKIWEQNPYVFAYTFELV